MPNVNEIAAIIENRREDLGLSQAEVSERAFGRKENSAIQNIKRGSSPSAEKLEALAGALDLEFYFGPKREGTSALPAFSNTTIPHHGLAKCSVRGWGKDQPNMAPLPPPEFINDPDAFYVSAIGQSMMLEGIDSSDYCLISPAQDVREGDRVWVMDRTGATSIKRLEKMTGNTLVLRGWLPIEDEKQTSFHDEVRTNFIKRAHPVVAVFRGKPGLAGTTLVPDPMNPLPQIAASIDLEEFALVRMHDIQLAAGDGRITWDETPTSAMAFPKPWLRQKGISPSAASLVFIAGDSMEPTLPAGAMVMVNHSRTDIRSRRIYAFRQGDELRVKRLELLSDGQMLVTSDNPDRATELIPNPENEQIKVIGEVVWVGSSIAK